MTKDQLAEENERLQEALRLAKKDLLAAMRHIERELTYIPPLSNGVLGPGEGE